MDRGSWTVAASGDRIDSDDFKHDASLILYGDFRPEDRVPYLQSIADKLNSESAKDVRIKELEYQNKQFEEYMLKGVVFRDELQSRLAPAEKVIKAARRMPYAARTPLLNAALAAVGREERG